ncbi:membrane protein, putative [Caballeronia glathei]|jgi:predicted PurR-regulated permease PerM|uniref:Membrane protein n=1 Tax=Caballeronia glathei TaxID=60547 RepID=A0A069PWK4_9BURK|nr:MULTISPECIES: AI-2E family transporter [Burkholderiaceae]KDR44807.1 membrane protein [Caballeronia glathei]TCK42477.1 putative PurR-regulated permease PerM [Paraburkholderia sp. BL8N3]CEJ96294.1 membrane protein, putative [Caballeronia glathei]
MAKRNEAAEERRVRDLPARPVRLTSDMSLPKLSAVEIGSYFVAFAGMFLVMHLKLLGGLLAGMLVYQLVHMIAPLIEKRMASGRARLVAAVLLSVIIIGGLTGATIATIEHFERDVPSLQKLLDQLMTITSHARLRVPDWVANYLPVDSEQMKDKATELMHKHAAQLQQGGKDMARGFGHVLIGMIIGAIIAVGVPKHAHRLPLSTALVTRVTRFSDAFRRIVFAQIKISAINAVFTAMYLLIALPIFHERLPLSKTLVLITFIVGLLPVIGNLISNTIIVAISLSISFGTAVASLAFLIIIHKLEYFLNARIIGGQIEARAWELLLAMLAMEAAFGLPGVIAAPIFYAYIKRELIYLRLV